MVINFKIVRYESVNSKSSRYILKINLPHGRDKRAGQMPHGVV